MPLRDDILNPIPGENPSGADLHLDTQYDEIRKAREEEEDLNQGAWQHERKVADWPRVSRLAQELLATRTKDLQLAGWLTEALLKTEGFAGLRQGLDLCTHLVKDFWDTLYPTIEDGDLEVRANRLNWLDRQMQLQVKLVPITVATAEGHGPFSYLQYADSNLVRGAADAKAREAMLKAGRTSPELFDKALGETKKGFYKPLVKDLDACLQSLKALDAVCREKFGELEAPRLTTLGEALREVRKAANDFLQEKLKIDPDPVEAPPPEAREEGGEAAAASVKTGTASGPAGIVIPIAASEPADRRAAIESIANAAALLRKREPHNPAPYLMLRGLRWGELRAAAAARDPTPLEAPPTELRQHIKRLALEQRWKDLLETAESAMALPCSRAWLDLQRFVVEACLNLGAEYHLIAGAIRSELKALLRDMPQLFEATLMDDTPAANAETQAWLRQLLAEPASPPAGNPEDASAQAPASPEVYAGNGRAVPGSWQSHFVDSYTLALEAQRAGRTEEAVEILKADIARLRSGRARFLRKLQLVEICIAAGKDAIAQPILEDLAAAIETHKLDEWEDREMVAKALATIMKLSKKVQGDAKEKQKIFERICRLDPVQALNC
jgi:type VI secretion system protein ImpA